MVNSNLVFGYSINGLDISEDDIVRLFNSVDWIKGAIRVSMSVKKALSNSHVAYCKDSNGIIGFCSAITDGFNVCITWMLVSKEYQGKGIGSKLLQCILTNHDDCRFHVDTTKARDFYVKNGFKQKEGCALRFDKY